MKVFVSSIGEVNAKRPMSTSEMVVYMKAVTGKKAEMEVDPSMTIAQFAEATKTALGIDSSVPVSRIDVLKGKTVLKGTSLFLAGVTDHAAINVKFVYNYGH
jgi:hypothetical protein